MKTHGQIVCVVLKEQVDVASLRCETGTGERTSGAERWSVVISLALKTTAGILSN